MNKILITLSFLLLLFTGCTQNNKPNKKNILLQTNTTDSNPIIKPKGNTLSTRFNPPKDFKRTKIVSNKFGSYLRNLPLKTHNAKVKYYNEKTKNNFGVYHAVVDLPIGKKDLHQCADAIIRLRAEYLFKQKRYTDIHFNFTNGFQVEFTKWQEGARIVVHGNKVFWKNAKVPLTAKDNYPQFWKYLECVFTYAGTLSLSKELTSININNATIGDVLIQGGSPGHAVIIVDESINPITNKKVFLLAQSYMPAQEIQILQNPNNMDGNPWYSFDLNEEILTPEWTFKVNDLKRFDSNI